MPEVSAQRKTFDPFRTVNRSISPFVGDLRLQVGVSTNEDRNVFRWESIPLDREGRASGEKDLRSLLGKVG